MLKLTKTSYFALLLFSLGTISNSNCMWEKTKNFVKKPSVKYVIGGIAGTTAGVLARCAIPREFCFYLLNTDNIANIAFAFIIGVIAPYGTAAITALLAHKYSELAAIMTVPAMIACVAII